MISLLKHNTKQWYIKTAKNLGKIDGINKNFLFQLRYQAKKYSTPLLNVWLYININCIFSYHNFDHKWVLYGCSIYMGTTSHVLKDYIINHYDCKTHKICQITTPFPFFCNGVEWNGVVKLKVFLGLLKIYGQ